MPRANNTRAILLIGAAAILSACGSAPPDSQSALTPQEARQIAKEAYIYGFPLVTNYQTMYKQAIDTANSDCRAPFKGESNALRETNEEVRSLRNHHRRHVLFSVFLLARGCGAKKHRSSRSFSSAHTGHRLAAASSER